MTGSDAQLAAAVMSAIAAIAAAIATWRGPIAAAQLAERLRRDSEARTDSRRFKLNVFAAIMQERAMLHSTDGVRALNSIDVAFSDAEAVRESWAELYQAFGTQPFPPPHVVEERTRKLLREMAADLGLAERLRLDDFGRIYFPTAMLKERQVQELQREASLKQLLPAAAAANTTAIDLGIWPPKPE